MNHPDRFDWHRGRVITAACTFLLLLFGGAPALAQQEGKRVALIVGNNNYSLSPLRNAVNDARLMDRTLQAAGFRTILRLDATQTVLEEAAAEFIGQLGPDDTALFFYAGHGVQIESENFLVPVDFQAASTVSQAKFRCFRMALLLDQLKNRTKRSIIILDACRTNPVAQSNRLDAGLAQPQNAGRETYIAYSTSPGEVAADNAAGRNSWFTEALADLMDQPGLTLDEVFTRVKSRVSSETDRRQSPWTISSLTSTFYFHTPADVKAENDPTLAEKWMVEAQRREQRQQWSLALNLLDQILRRKPGGALEAAAVARVPYLRARAEAQTKFDAGDFKAAALAFEKALELDPFSSDAAFQAVNSYLLCEQLADAVRLLNGVRLRGANASIGKADAMLKELGSVYPEALTALNRGIPDPPSIQELFRSIQFDKPDWNAGIRVVQSSSASVTRWAKALQTQYPPPPEPIEGPGSNGAGGPALSSIAKDFFHIEVVPSGGETRDISIRRLNDPEPTGMLMLSGPSGQTFVMANGAVVDDKLPTRLPLAPGKYQVREVERGRVLSSQDFEITATQTVPVTVQGRR